MQGRAADLGTDWFISPYCPSEEYHNTLRAAYGASGKNKRNRHAPCTCPHALELKRKDMARKEQERLARKRENPSPVIANFRINVSQRANATMMPTNGTCTSPLGQEIMGYYIDNPGRPEAIRNARRLCDGCPVLNACYAWVTQAEARPGAWDGMYAGLTPRQRASSARSTT